ncbi:DUF4337 domain-containing protein [Labrys sp. KNU-23]|uniref:DUF4337 family protein n=1 Tax=Labrys sp. KNU-23 TaxID=2789216 RepID=UPI0011ED6395|nr:DUF4337 family protein [Labrys sp. KNU-23]QEN90624.1 DUF4337 domain-containing protein [Labrys sp. KNU-23]
MEDETQDHLEHAEHAEHAAHDGNPFLITVSVTIAVLAVLAATVGSFESLETAEAINDKSEAAYLQNKASDQWAFYQAKSIKKNAYEIAAAGGGPNKDDFLAKAKHNDDDAKAIQAQAVEIGGHVDAKLRDSEVRAHRHHVLTLAVTLLHVAIAVATLSIITRGKRWPWLCSLVLGAMGMVAAVFAYV